MCRPFAIAFPESLLQWEDFKQQNAFDLLDRYRKVLPSFNDDIQGTAAVALAGILSAVRATGVPQEEQRIVILGPGAAGVGIARQLRPQCDAPAAMAVVQTRNIALLDSGGLLIQGRPFREAAKHEFAWPAVHAAALGFTPETPGNFTVVDAAQTNDSDRSGQQLYRGDGS